MRFVCLTVAIVHGFYWNESFCMRRCIVHSIYFSVHCPAIVGSYRELKKKKNATYAQCIHTTHFYHLVVVSLFETDSGFIGIDFICGIIIRWPLDNGCRCTVAFRIKPELNSFKCTCSVVRLLGTAMPIL